MPLVTAWFATVVTDTNHGILPSMIRQLCGDLVRIEPGSVVLDVNGVGYLVAVTKTPATTSIGTEITLHTHLAVRENALDLYGFETLDELEIFEHLLSIPKVGPKSALQILSQADVPLLKEAVLTHDPSHLSKLSGIGKKTAEKIVNELHDSFTERYEGAVTVGTNTHTQTSDVIDALVALGYPLADARAVSQSLPAGLSTNEAVSTALRQLGNGS